MKVHIVVTDSTGTVYEGDTTLVAQSGGSPRATRRRPTSSAATNSVEPDMGLPARAFMSRYARGLNGSGRYALLVARLCEGKLNTRISAREVEKQWNSMKEPMGGPYNSAHMTRARDKGWVDMPEKGTVVLLRHWTAALKGN